MKFFIRIEGEQRGPYELNQLVKAGVTPDTYVWTKGMADWEQARTQPDICRYFRQRLSGTLPEDSSDANNSQRAIYGATSLNEGLKSVERGAEEGGESEDPMERLARGEKISMNDIMQHINEQYSRMAQEQRNPTRPPRVPLAMIIVSILFCPPTGIASLILGLKARRLWKEAPQGEEGAPTRRESHDCAASARMWMGISFFLGIIIWTAIFFR